MKKLSSNKTMVLAVVVPLFCGFAGYWRGANGLAFGTTLRQLVVIQTSLIPSPTPSTPPEIIPSRLSTAGNCKAGTNERLLFPTPSPTPVTSNRCLPVADPDPESIYDTGPEDWDCDGVCNRVDNCMFAYNPKQKDRNGDGDGDACDPATVPEDFTDIRCDMDGDGILDSQDNCPAACNRNQRDSDHNNIGDACDGKNSSKIQIVRCKKQLPLKLNKKTQLLPGSKSDFYMSQ